MDNHYKTFIKFLTDYANQLPVKQKQLLLATPKTQLHLFHFSVGLDIRNRLLGDQNLMLAFANFYIANSLDDISSLFVADLQHYLVQNKSDS